MRRCTHLEPVLRGYPSKYIHPRFCAVINPHEYSLFCGLFVKVLVVLFAGAGGLLFPVYFYPAPVAIFRPVGNSAEGLAAGGAGLDSALSHDGGIQLFVAGENRIAEIAAFEGMALQLWARTVQHQAVARSTRA